MSKYKLTQNIIALSNSKVWDSAKREWGLNDVYQADEPETCLCGHSPIIEVCVLGNTHNYEKATVGNHCVKKFIGLPSDKIFQSVKRVRKDNTKALNAEALKHAHNKGWINDWEYNFGIDTRRKRKLSDKQARTRTEINEKMMFNMKRMSSKGA
jgi:hypothetical protein